MPESPFRTERFTQLTKETLIEMYRNRRMELPKDFDPRNFAVFLDRENGKLELRTLEYHHRSADFAKQETVRERGEHGHVYCTFDVKGVGFLYPETYESKKDSLYKGICAGFPEAYVIPGSSENPWGYNSLGLLDERLFMKTAQNAEQLADAGARVEGIVAAYRLGQIMFKGKPLDVKEYKKNEIASLRASDEPEMASDMRENFEPILAVRAMRSVFRLRDLSDAETDEEAVAMMEESCTNLNHEAEQQNRPVRFDSRTPEGREKWVRFIAYWTGKNVGIIHRLGMAHLFLHMGNLSLAGEVVDLDSVGPVIQRRRYKKRPQDRLRHKDAPFYHETPEGCAFISDEMGKHQSPDDQHRLPKCLAKDFRDSCFSFRQMVYGGFSRAMQGRALDPRAIAREMIRGYAEGIGESEPFADIGVTNARLKEVFTAIAENVVGLNLHYPPIPPDSDKKE